MAELLARYSARERFIVLIALLVMFILATHAFVIEPYQNRIVSLGEEIEQSKSDLQWMASMVHRIPTNVSNVSQQSFSGSLANLIDQAVKQQNLNSFLAQMTPKGEEEIRVRFSAVPFDQLIRFIAKMSDQGLRVKDLRINASDNPAQVDSNLVLNKG